MNRSIWKNPNIDLNILLKLNSKNKIIKTKSRNSVIISDFIGYSFEVYNGHKYIKITITPEMVGRKLGEFSFTRLLKKNIHIKK